jgi:hypothetical protein
VGKEKERGRRLRRKMIIMTSADHLLLFAL